MRIASIGPITSKTVRDQGYNVDVEARQHDIDGLVAAISKLFAQKT
jgi:uroporphyrinogen III methyltransferase/synthase